MKTIYIVRHAKSSWDNPDLPDEKRPLLEKGINRTRKVARYLLRQHIPLDFIVTSHAVRAYETARLLAEGLDFPVSRIHIKPEIYHSVADQIPALFLDLPDNIAHVMIVGHNPSFTDLVNLYLPKAIESLPTSGVVSISFETDSWEKIPLAKSMVNFIIFPDKLAPED
jgi:phosphohistidine phosphatase